MIDAISNRSCCYLYPKCALSIRGDCTHDMAMPDSYCEYLFRVDWLLKKSLLTDKQIHTICNKITLGVEDNAIRDDLNAIRNNIRQFVSSGGNVYMYSEHAGNGKTTCAVRLLQDYVKSVWNGPLRCRALFISVSRMFYELKLAMSNEPSDYLKEIRENVLTADLIVWDDICTTSPTSYEYNTLLNWINCRIDAGLSNIYTSNMPPNKLQELFDDRFVSRVCNLSKTIRFRGSDIRDNMCEVE